MANIENGKKNKNRNATRIVMPSILKKRPGLYIAYEKKVRGRIYRIAP